MIPSPLSRHPMGQLVVPIVHRRGPHHDFESERMAALARGHTACGPVDGSNLVAFHVTSESRSQGRPAGPVQPLGLEGLRGNRPVLVTSAIRSQIVVAGADMNTVAEPRIRRSLTTKTVRRKRKRPFEAEYALLAELGLRRN